MMPSDKVVARLNKLRCEGLLCDVFLMCGYKEFKAHKVVLAASCDYFQALFTSPMQEKDSIKVNMEVPTSVVEELLTFLYTGETRLCESNVKELLIAADYLMIEELKLQCVDYLICALSSTTCLQIYSLGVKYNAQQLKRKSESFILKNFTSLRKRHEFMDLDFKLLQSILRNDDLVVKGEEEVYEAIVSWVDHGYEERASSFDKLFQYGVRLCSIPEDFVMNTISQNPLVKQSHVCMSHVIHRLQSTSATNNEQILQPRKCLRIKNQALVCLGGITSGKSLKDTLAYVPYQNQWIHLEDMSVGREEHVVVVCNDLLYVIGGMRTSKNIDCFEPRLNAWSTVAVLPERAITSAGVCVDGKIYIIGGKDGFESVSTVQCYDSSNNVVEMLAPLTFPRNALCAVALHGDIYVIGGCTYGNDCLETVERIKIGWKSNWQKVSPMKYRRKYACAAVLSSGNIMVVGGYHDTCSTALNCCEVYNPESNDWQEICSLISPRAASGLACVANQVYIVGGRSDRTSTDTLEYYDEEHDTWCMSTTRLPHPCAWLQCGVVALPNTLLKTDSES